MLGGMLSVAIGAYFWLQSRGLNSKINDIRTSASNSEISSTLFDRPLNISLKYAPTHATYFDKLVKLSVPLKVVEFDSSPSFFEKLANESIPVIISNSAAVNWTLESSYFWNIARNRRIYLRNVRESSGNVFYDLLIIIISRSKFRCLL